jgi:hypothetical protein
MLFFLPEGVPALAHHDAAQTFCRHTGRYLKRCITRWSEEIVVTQAEKPVKERVREWLKREISERRPPPDISEIRRTLGWEGTPPGEADKRGRRKP